MFVGVREGVVGRGVRLIYYYFIYFMVSQYKNKRSEVDSEKDVVIETLWYCTVGILK